MAKMQQALKQIQKMQAEMERVQEELAVKTVTKTVGGAWSRLDQWRLGGQESDDRTGSVGG